ncbi:MAG TPA: YjbE family putative metal transport protein [Acetobacteraceae bacterium]|nr:YjbE family putative metal transport protein [Acetobacteraceae bacterium]
MSFDWSHELGALAQVVLIDVALAGDNAVVVGLAAAGLPEGQRRKAIALGIGAATAIRIGFGLVALSLLQVIGLTLAGGLLLLWVAWKMYRDIAGEGAERGRARSSPTLARAMLRIVLADVSMSLDNVLAVAGASGESKLVLTLGLLIGVLLMAVAADAVARIIARWRWLAWAGLAMVVYVALRMIWDGSHQVASAFP